MKRMRIIVSVVVCCAVAFMGVYGSGCSKGKGAKDKEVMYEGKPESYWLKMMKDPDPLSRRDAIVAFGKMPPDPQTFCPTGTIKPVYDEDGLCVTSFRCVPRCKATGCSGQVCAAKDVITTCEFLPWYGCYKLSRCGNFGPDESCAWEETDEFAACMTQHGQ